MQPTSKTALKIKWTAMAATVCMLTSFPSPALAQEDRFPDIRPATRAQAETAITGGASLPLPCLTPLLHAMHINPSTGPDSAARAADLLRTRGFVPADHRSLFGAGVEVIFTTDPNSFDRIDDTDANGDGIPNVAVRARMGLARARRFLVNELELSPPERVTVFLTRIAGNISGYTVQGGPDEDSDTLLVIDAGPGSSNGEVIRATIHQYSHAVLLANGTVPPEWAEAFATWTVLRLTGMSDPGLRQVLETRRQRLSEGLFTDNLELIAGNALWFAFLYEAHGPLTLKLTLDQLSLGIPAETALRTALRRGAGLTLEEAFREFHLWNVLTGEHADEQHFPFAAELESPHFISDSEFLPVISVQEDPALAPLGAAQAIFKPGRNDGGLTIRFEGEFPARWESDLLLAREDGKYHRLAISIGPDGRGEVTVPLDSLTEVILMIRNTGGEVAAPRRYTWTAHRVNGFPFEISSLGTSRTDGETGGVMVSWETSSEQRLVGYNILRKHPASSISRRINPIWVPAIGDLATPASYQYLDLTAQPGVAYTYRLEGITLEGLRSTSDPVSSP